MKRIFIWCLVMVLGLVIARPSSGEEEVEVKEMGGGAVLSLGGLRIEISPTHIATITYQGKRLTNKVAYVMVGTEKVWTSIADQANPFSFEPLKTEKVADGVRVNLFSIIGSEQYGKWNCRNTIFLSNEGRMDVIYAIENILDKKEARYAQFNADLSPEDYKDVQITVEAAAKIEHKEGKRTLIPFEGEPYKGKFAGLYNQPRSISFPVDNSGWGILIKKGIFDMGLHPWSYCYSLQLVARPSTKEIEVTYDFSELVKEDFQ